MKESEIQRQIVDYLSMSARRERLVFFSVPNEGTIAGFSANRGKAFAIVNALKNMGMTPGVADLVICKAGRVFMLEIKTDKGRQSVTQKAFEQACRNAEIPYNIVRSLDEALSTLRLWRVLSA